MSEYLQVDLQNLIQAMLRQYKNKFVVIREAIQNSVDAGAKHIVISINDKCLRIDDNGVGMNVEEIKRYWNTLGRTSKRREDGAIGEFGLGRLTLLLLSDEMHMETMKKRMSYHVVTDRLGKISIQSGNRRQRGTSVWVNTLLPLAIRQQFIDYAETVAKARSEIIELNGRKISQNRYGPPTEVAASLKINEQGMRGCIWIPLEALGRGRTNKGREAVIKVYVNDLFVKNLASDYYLFGEINCNDLRLVTSRDDLTDDVLYEKFYTNLMDVIETRFYPSIASNEILVNDARIKNDILRAASKRSDKKLIEKMVFETTSGEKLTGKDVLSKPDIFVVAESNPRDRELGDKFHHLGAGVSIIAPTGLKTILSRTIGTIRRSDVAIVVKEKLSGRPVSLKEQAEFKDVGKLITLLSGCRVDFKKGMGATAQYDKMTRSIAINIEAPVFKEAKKYLMSRRRDLAMIRVLGTVAHELAHGKVRRAAEVHDVEFYKVFEQIVDELGSKVILLMR